MSKLKEQIIRSLNLQNNTFVNKDGITQSFQPGNGYLLPNEDGTHDRWVTDDNNIISKQDKGIISINAGANIIIDNTDPKNLIINSFDIDHENRLTNLEAINYIWSPANRTLTLYDNNGSQLSQVSLISLDNEGTDLRYNASTLSLELWNADNELLDSIPVSSFIGSVGTQLQLNSNQLQLKDSQGNVLSTVGFMISNIQGLQTALDGKLDKGTYAGTAQDLKNSIDSKLNKPTTTSNTTSYTYVVGEDGNGGSARLPAGDLGKNFFNSDLSNTTARNHTMNAGVTINTLGNLYAIKGLLDKTNNTTYSKKLCLNPSTGEVVTKDNSDPTDVTNAINAASTAQKTTMRTALLGTTTPANPVINSTAPQYTTRGTVFIDLYGINLTLLDPTQIWIEKVDGTKIYAITFYNLTSYAVTTQWDLPPDLPNGDYPIKIQNGVTVQGLSTAKLTVVDSIATLNFMNADWKVKRRTDSNGVEIAGAVSNINQSNNYIKFTSNATGYDSVNNTTPTKYASGIFKTQNLLLGNKDWDISMVIERSDSGLGSYSPMYQFIGLTETSHTDFTDILNIIYNNIALYNDVKFASFTTAKNNIDLFFYTNLYIYKNGNKLFVRMSRADNTGSVYYQTTIDTSKNYAIFFQGNWNTSIKGASISARIMN